MLASLDRSSPLPLWAQIASDLEHRLAKGEFDQRFPTDEELTRDYGVSRQTVREGVRHLSAQGLVVRQRGKGTSVSHPVVEQPLHSIYSLASSVRATGMEERSEVRAVERCRAPSNVAVQLDLERGSEVVYVERLRFAGTDPFAWDRSWLPAEQTAPLLEADLSSGSLYDCLAERCELRVTGGRERISPVIPTRRVRSLLRLPTSAAVFSVERLALAGDCRVEWRESVIRGDRYSLIAQWPSPAQHRIEQLT